MRTFIFLALSGLIASCRSDKKTSLYFLDTVESNYAWNGNHIPCIIKSEKAHSGMYMCKVNKDYSSSVTFNMRLGDISPKPLKAVTVSGWIMLTGNNSERNITIDIRNQNDSMVEYFSHNTGYDLRDINKWVYTKYRFNLSKKNRNNIDNRILVYFYNSKEEPIYVDDIAVEFEE
jgi:hypothetical protein